MNKIHHFGKSCANIDIVGKNVHFTHPIEILTMTNAGFFALIFTSIVLLSCSKTVENKKHDVLLQIMTHGQWHVASYTEGTSSVTAAFEGYNFQFDENGAVTGIKDSISITGTWQADLENYSIISNFPPSAEPVNKLNGSWKIKDSGLDYVEAEMATGQGISKLHLKKSS